jgi:tetratricopeptide (TPR) repeat protein
LARPDKAAQALTPPNDHELIRRPIQRPIAMLCSDENLQSLLATLRTDEGAALARASALIEGFPDDARLHFLRGSMLIGAGRHIEAHGALSRAVELAPDFHIARFQLGFFELTSGEPARAVQTWGPLEALPPTHYLKLFVIGLGHLIRDEFGPAVAHLEEGMRANDENAALNRDMQLLIDQCAPLMTKSGTALPPSPETSQIPATDEKADSATSFILRQLTGKRR